MSRLLVSGLINLETTLRVDGFPVAYDPVRYPFGGVHGSVSGVGYNLAKALRTLGNEVELLSMVGRDPAATLVRPALERDGLLRRFPARALRPVASTIGAGDALFSAFVDGYLRGLDAVAALARAQAFAAWKIGVTGAAEGFLDADRLEALHAGR